MSWTEVLSDCEDRMLACRGLLSGDLDAATADYLRDLSAGETLATPASLVRFVPPEGLGPLPADLAPRVRAILECGTALEADFTARRDEVMARLRSLASAQRPAAYGGGAEAPRPSVLDQHG
jgi:hypothetical protein